jgi:hypothetical protein
MSDTNSNGSFDELSSIARLAASAARRSAEWSLLVPVRATRRALEVAMAPEKAADLVAEIRDTASSALRELIAIADGDGRARSSDNPTGGVADAVPGAEAARRVADAVPGGEVARRVADAVPGGEVARRVADAVPGGDVARRVAETIATPEEWRHTLTPGEGRAAGNGNVPLRVRGQELIDLSRDVHYEERAHPAYERLVESLAPDEARILRLLLFHGPQPAVDVRTGGPLGLVQSRLVAPGFNMIGARAGCRYVERVPSYLTNLHRLGMIWFSRETLRDPQRYQVLEAQPDVLAAIHSVRHAKIVRRSIHLTPFGEDFCRAVLAEDEDQLVDLPEHASPAKPREPGPPEPPS